MMDKAEVLTRGLMNVEGTHREQTFELSKDKAKSMLLLGSKSTGLVSFKKSAE